MRSREHVLLALLLAAAAVLRFAGLGGDLRRGSPTPDEWENFVGPVEQMWEVRSLDPHVHGGYPGLFNWIVFVPMGLGAREDGEAGATLAGRVVVAAFSTLNVLLVYLVCRGPWGAAAALLAAALLAFSRSEVSEGHYITPDVLVVSAFLALLLAARRGRGVLAGVLAGLGTAIKYSGVLLFPALFAELLAQRRYRRLAASLGCAVAAFAATAPFALLMKRDQRRGVDEFAVYYFGPLLSGSFLQTAPRQLGEVLSWIWINLGPLGVALALASVLARPRRPLAAPAAVLGASLAVLSFAGQVYPRHILLASAAATVLAGAGFAAARARVPSLAAAVVLAAATVALPLWRAAQVAHGYTRPTELDEAAAWIEAQGRPLRVATSLERLRLQGPVEVRAGLPLWAWPAEALGHFDVVVAPRAVADRLASLRVLRTFERPGNAGGAVFALAGARGEETAWPPPSAARATAPGSERAWDGDPRTDWTAPAGAGWIEAEWPAPRRLHAIEIAVPAGEGYWPQRLRVRARLADGSWAAADGLPIRPARAALQQPPHGQVLVLGEPVEADALRIERRDGARWALSEVRVFSPAVEAGSR